MSVILKATSAKDFLPPECPYGCCGTLAEARHRAGSTGRRSRARSVQVARRSVKRREERRWRREVGE